VNAQHRFGTLATSLSQQMHVIFMALFMELNIQIDSFSFSQSWKEQKHYNQPLP
jgi:hypothetical protein